MMDMVCQSAR